MKTPYLFVLGLLSLACSAQAQSALNLETGQNFTKMYFTDDQAESDDAFTYNFSSSWSIGYEYALKEGVFFAAKVGLRSGGASYVYDQFNYRWDLSYADVKLGVGYRHAFNAFSVQFSAQGYYAHLYKAEQRLHNVNRDMLAAESIDNMDVGIFLTPGAYYQLNEKLSIGLEANYMLGLWNLELDEGQKTTNELIGSSIGLRIKL
jgi:hypothetical protein